MHHKKTPLLTELAPPRPSCPVCGSPTYSRQGVHPQCALQQADAERMRRLKARKLKAAAKPVVATGAKSDSLAVRPWHKRCPECQAQSHISRKACECGHQFGEKPG